MQLFLLVAWRNIWRNTRRTLITASAMAVSVAMCIFLMLITNGFYDVFFDVMVTKKMGHVQIKHEDYPKTRSIHDTIMDGNEIIETIRSIPTTQGIGAKLYSSMLVSAKEDSNGAMVTGIIPKDERELLHADTSIVQGAYLSDMAQKEVIIGNSLFTDLQTELGAELFVYTQASDGSMAYDNFTIVGVYKTGAALLDKGVQMHVQDLQELLIMPNQFHEITALTSDAEHIEEYKDTVAKSITTTEKSPITIKTWWETAPQMQELMAFQHISSYIFLGIVFFISGFGVLNTTLMSVYERTREIGVMKALGMRPNRIIFLIILENIFLSMLASILGVVLGLFLNYFLQEHGIDMSGGTGEPLSVMGFNLDPIMKKEIDFSAYHTPIIGLFLISIVTALWPAYRASRLDPIEAIRSE